MQPPGVEVAGELVFPVPDRTYVVGRRPPADIVVADPLGYVSAQHLSVRYVDTRWEVINESLNGSFFPDGRRLDSTAHPLTGDVTSTSGRREGRPSLSASAPCPPTWRLRSRPSQRGAAGPGAGDPRLPTDLEAPASASASSRRRRDWSGRQRLNRPLSEFCRRWRVKSHRRYKPGQYRRRSPPSRIRRR